MPGVAPKQYTRPQWLAEFVFKPLARMAMGALDGEHHGPRSIPSALTTATSIGNALKARKSVEIDGEAKEIGGKGASVDELFEGIAVHVDPDRLDAIELLGLYYQRIVAAGIDVSAAGTLGTGAIVDVVRILVRDIDAADSDGDVSLWCRFMQAVWPLSAQTPGSPKWGANGPNAVRESRASAFAPWQKVPGTW